MSYSWIIINCFASTIPQIAWSKCHTHEDQFMDIFDNIDIMEQQCEVLISKIVFLTSKNLILCAKSLHYPYINYTTPWRSLILHTLAWHLKVLVKLPLSQDFKFEVWSELDAIVGGWHVYYLQHVNEIISFQKLIENLDKMTIANLGRQHHRSLSSYCKSFWECMYLYGVISHYVIQSILLMFLYDLNSTTMLCHLSY
jgi:hypothetical protein